VLLAVPASVRPQSGRLFRVLYLFCGQVRKGDIKEHLLNLQQEFAVQIYMIEHDLERDPVHSDLSDHSRQVSCLASVDQQDFVIATPPCKSYSRSLWSNSNGPPPLRSATYPRGFPWLSNRDKAKVALANDLVDFSFSMMEAVEEVRKSRFCGGLLEHPEDLGQVKAHDPFTRPASIWQDARPRDLVRKKGWKSVAFHQGPLGAITVKPTRILYPGEIFNSFGPSAWPRFNAQGRYEGPLPKMTNPKGVQSCVEQGMKVHLQLDNWLRTLPNVVQILQGTC
jgi:hypothetical protein